MEINKLNEFPIRNGKRFKDYHVLAQKVTSCILPPSHSRPQLEK